MSFVKKIWKDRISQFPNRRTINDGYVTKQVTVGRDEGAVTEEGTPFDATEMNDLENRIYAAIEEGGGGGGGAGTYDYTELFNKPRINNHELNGNKSLGDLGIASNANELPIESGSATTTKDYIDDGLDEKADTSDFNDETGVTVTCPRCPIASISRDFARKSGNVLFYGTKISFGNTSESGNIYFFVNKAITNSFIMGTLYDNATDQVYSLGKNYGRDTMWLRQGNQPVSASIFQGKTEISLSLMIIL